MAEGREEFREEGRGEERAVHGGEGSGEEK
jgi:hypothetical protein